MVSSREKINERKKSEDGKVNLLFFLYIILMLNIVDFPSNIEVMTIWQQCPFFLIKDLKKIKIKQTQITTPKKVINKRKNPNSDVVLYYC